MLATRLDQIDERLLSQLCSDECPESQTLDFKFSLPRKDEPGKVEFAKDVCAFANADGGEIVFGISDTQGRASAPCPIDTEPSDAAQRRLIQTIDRLIEPRIVGVQFHTVPFGKAGYILLVRVPQSFDGPHRFATEGGASRFVIRVGTMTQDLTYTQLRGAFDRTATLAAKASDFRSSRINAIKSGRTWKPMPDGVKWVVHLLPVSAMAGRTQIDIQALNSGSFAQFNQRGWGGVTRTLNLDGMAVHPAIRSEHEGRAYSYVQVFRSGVLEGSRFGGRLVDDRRIIPGGDMSAYFRERLTTFIAATRGFGVRGPAIMGAALLDTAGYALGVFNPRSGMSEASAVADRPDMVVPEAWIDDIESVTDVDLLVRPLLDVLYQSFGIERCFEYDERGQWVAR